MGTCPIRCRSNLTILENPPELETECRLNPNMQNDINVGRFSILKLCLFFCAAEQESVIVSLYDYPSFGHTELTMRMGERLAILSEYVIWLRVHLASI